MFKIIGHCDNLNSMCEKLTEKELDILVIRIQHMSAKDLQNALKHHMFSTKENPYIEGYLQHKIEEERNAPTYMYHRRKAPEGKIFKAYEVPALKKGWVDSPIKFKKTIKDKIIDIKNIFFAFWCKEWKWILGFIVTIITLYIAYLKLITMK